MDNRPSAENLQKFILEVSKLEAIEFFGLVKVLNVELYENNEEKTPRKFETVMSEIMDRYMKLSRKGRREILKMIKMANLKKIDV